MHFRQSRSFNVNDSLDASGSDNGSNSSLQWKSFEAESFDVNGTLDSIDESDLGTSTPLGTSALVGLKAERCRVTNLAEIDILVRLYTEMIKGT